MNISCWSEMEKQHWQSGDSKLVEIRNRRWPEGRTAAKDMLTF